jgi:hypothetical protein
MIDASSGSNMPQGVFYGVCIFVAPSPACEYLRILESYICVHIACLGCSPLYTMIGIDSVYYIPYICRVLVNRTPLCSCFICVFMCCVAAWCVFAVSCVWFQVSCSIFVDILFYIHSICMFLCDCMLFGCVKPRFSPL